MKYQKNKSETLNDMIENLQLARLRQFHFDGTKDEIFLPRVSFTTYLKANKHFTPLPNFLLKSTNLAIEGNLAFSKA